MQSIGHQRPSYRVRREARGRECRGRVRAHSKVEKGERRAGQRLTRVAVGTVEASGELRASSGRAHGELMASSGRAQGELMASSWRAHGELRASSWRAQGELRASSGPSVAPIRRPQRHSVALSGTRWQSPDGSEQHLKGSVPALGRLPYGVRNLAAGLEHAERLRECLGWLRQV